MTEEELLSRLQAGEGPFCEWKASAKTEEVRAAVVAFANTVRAPNVGVLFLGISPDGTPSGNIADPDKTQRDARRCVESCYPPIQGIQLYPFGVNGQNVIAVVVTESQNGPHFTGPAYVRVGSETRAASPEMFEALVADRTQAARLLRPWSGQEIRVQSEYEPIPGHRRWPDALQAVRLVALDATGLTIELSNGMRVSADWGRARLQPIQPGQAPLVRISMD